MALSVLLTEKQIGDIVEDNYIDSKIQQCESFLDDIDPEDEQDAFDQVSKELEEWKSLKSQLETQYLGKE